MEVLSEATDEKDESRAIAEDVLKEIETLKQSQIEILKEQSKPVKERPAVAAKPEPKKVAPAPSAASRSVPNSSASQDVDAAAIAAAKARREELVTQVRAAIQKVVTSMLGPNIGSKIDAEDNLFQLGISSSMVTMLSDGISEELHAKMPLTLVYDYPTIANMADYIVDENYVK